MKKIHIIIIFIIALLGVIFYKLKKDISKLDYEIAGFKLNIKSASDVLTAMLSGLSAKMTINLINLSNTDYTVKELFIELYTLTGDLIASPLSRTDNSILKANSKTPIEIMYNIDTRGLFKLFSTLLKTKSIKEILTNYVDKGEVGQDIQIKGFAKAGPLELKLDFKYTV